MRTFLNGWNLNAVLVGLDPCLNATVQAVDDFYYFYDNLTQSTMDQWQLPVMNLTQTLANNFSTAIVNCYYFANKTYYYYLVRYVSEFSSNPWYVVLSFFLNFFGKAMTLKNIFTNIYNDVQTQNYYDVTY